MITLHTFPGTPELESFSPFCMKVEVYLKLQGFEYKAVRGNPRSGPKGKLPFIDDGDTRIGDSSMILAYLEKKTKTPLDAGLDPDARAQATLIQRTLEESLYWVLVWSRWVADDGWEHLSPRVAELMPAAVRWFMPGIIRGQVKKSVHAHGYGRHSRDQIFALGKADLEALAARLGDRPFFLDDELRTIDLSAYAFFANILFWGHASPLAAAMRTLPVLESYVKRVQARLNAAPARDAASPAAEVASASAS